MKKELIDLIDICRSAKLGAYSDNSLDSDARAMIDDSIKALTELRARAEAEPDTVGVDAIVNQVRDVMDEKIAAALEKVKDIAPTPSQNSDYLASKEAVRDFAQCLRSTNGASAFRAAWQDQLKRNGITPVSTELLMPAAIKSRIDDLWNSDTNWLRRLNNTGAKRFLIRYTSQGQDDKVVRAYGHTPKAVPVRKVEQSVSLDGRPIEVGAIYKLQRLDNLTIFNDDGALIEWIADELTRQVYYTIGRAALVGSTPTDTPYPIPDTDITSFKSVISDTSPFVTLNDIDASNSLIDEVMEKLIAPIYDGSDIALFMTPQDLFSLRRWIYATDGTPRYASIDEVKGMLGVSDIITVPYLTTSATTTKTPRMIAMHLDKYYTVGKMQNFEYLRFPDHLSNSEYFRVETFAGGAAGLNCAAVLENPAS